MFIWGVWVEFNEWAINDTLQCKVVEDDEFEQLMSEELDIECLQIEFYQNPNEVPWTIDKK